MQGHVVMSYRARAESAFTINPSTGQLFRLVTLNMIGLQSGQCYFPKGWYKVSAGD